MHRQKLIVMAIAAAFSLSAGAQTSTTPPNPHQAEIDANAQRKSALEAETATLNAEKARAEARKAALEAEVAAAKARIGVVEGTEDYKGGVSVKDKGGAMEAKLLASRAISEVSAKIARKVATKAPANQRILIFGGTTGPSYNNYVQFNSQLVVVDRALFDATATVSKPEAAADQALKEAQDRRAKTKPKPSAKPRTSGADVVVQPQAAPLAVAGAALSALNNLFSYLRTKYEIGGSETSIDESALVHGVADSLASSHNVLVPDAYLPTLVAQADTSGVVKELLALAKKKAEAVEAASRLTRKAEQITAFVKDESDAAQKAELEKHAATLTRVAGELAKAATVFDTFLGKLTTADEKGTVAFAVLLREQEIYRLLTDTSAPAVLLLKLQAQGGSYYTKENMWTFLGRMPFFNSGGAVASYALIDGKSGRVTSSGLESLHTGWMRADEIDSRVNRESATSQRTEWMGTQRTQPGATSLSD